MTTVLIVEDEPLVSLALREELTETGYNVLTAANASEAIEILELRGDIETIFTDVDMPGSMDGLQLAAAVRDRWPPVNIVITTGMKRPPAAEMPKGSVFIAKPYRFQDVVQAFRAFG